MLNCIIAGVGGQGTVLMSRVIGAAAIAQGLDVRGTETIGMAQRGGSVVSHVRMGEGIASPLIPAQGADVILALEPGEGVRALPFLREGGAMVVCDRAIRPVTSSLGGDGYSGEAMADFLRKNVKRLTVLDGEALLARLESARTLNVALLAVAAAQDLFPFTLDDVENVLRKRVSPKYMSMNQSALQLGAALARGQSDRKDG